MAGITRAERNERYEDPYPSNPDIPMVPSLSEPGVHIAVAPSRGLVVPAEEDPDFIVFRGKDHGWVLRDPQVGRDYPFHSREAALRGAAKRVVNRNAFIGANLEASLYGEPLEGIIKVYV